MKILLLANHFNTGGISTYILNLSRGLAARGHKVWVVSGGGNCVELLHGHAQHIELDIRVKSEIHPKLWLAAPDLVRLVRTEKMDILHANTRVTQVLAWWACRSTGRPFVSTCHGFFKPRLFRRMFPCWGRGVIAISRGVQDHLINDFHLDAAQVRLIYNGIDAAQFPLADDNRRQIKRQQWKAEGRPIIGIIARLSKVKGIDQLIKIFPNILRQFPDAKLWIVGDGPEKKNLQDLIAHRGLERFVRFEPVVNQTADILPVFDVFVLPSLQEGLGLSVIEAQACGIPVVASAVGGLPDVIEDGKTGFLFPPAQSDVMVRRIIELINNPAQTKVMAMAARQQIEQKFSLDQMAERTIEFYHEQNSGR